VFLISISNVVPHEIVIESQYTIEFLLFVNFLHTWLSSYQVKATAENVDEAVRELPDANLVRYSFFWVSNTLPMHIFFRFPLMHYFMFFIAVIWRRVVRCFLSVIFDDIIWICFVAETRRFVGNSFPTCLSTTSQKGQSFLDSNTKGTNLCISLHLSWHLYK